MAQVPEAPDPARREFLKLVTAAGVAAALPPSADALAQATPTPGGAPPQRSGPPEAAVPALSDDARALTAVLRRRVQATLTEAQWEAIARDFDGDLAMGKRLRALKFANGDEPDSTFKV